MLKSLAEEAAKELEKNAEDSVNDMPDAVETDKDSEDADDDSGNETASPSKIQLDIKEEHNIRIEKEKEEYNRIIEKLQQLDSDAEFEYDDDDDDSKVDSKIARSKHSCYVCGKGFNHDSSLRKHKLVHSTVKPHRWDKCGKSFRRYDALQSHQQGAKRAGKFLAVNTRGKCLEPALIQKGMEAQIVKRKQTFKETLTKRLVAAGWSKKMEQQNHHIVIHL